MKMNIRKRYLFSAALVCSAAVATTFARDNSKTIVCYGDSLTAGQASVVTQPTLDNYQNGYLNGKSVLAGYPYFLAKSLKDDGFSVVNISRGGMKTANILAMQGTKTFKTVKAFTLPADTSLVDFNNGVTDNYGPSQSNMAVDNAVATPPQLSPDEPLTTDGSGTCGSMCGVLKTSAGDIRVRWRVDRDNGNYLNIRRMTAGGASVAVPAGTVFVPDCAGNYQDAIQVIFAGQNDGAAGSASSIVPQIQSAVDNIGGDKRYVVVSYHTATDANCDAMKKTFDDAFGNHHLYLYGELKSRGLALASQLGETATASTWNTKTTGLLANDGLHFNRAGYHVLAYLVEEKLQALGYLGGTQPDAEPDEALEFAAIFQDHMVLQQGRTQTVWGKATPGSSVTVKLAKGSATIATSAAATAGSDGIWQATLAVPAATKGDYSAHALSVTSGSTTVTVSDVLLGEVWLASGQSNMQFPLHNVYSKGFDPSTIPATIRYRLLGLNGGKTVPTPPYEVAMEKDSAGNPCPWMAAPDAYNMKGSSEGYWYPTFSAVGYFFAKALQERIDLPVGIVAGVQGGTQLEPFCPGNATLWNYTFGPILKFAARGLVFYQGEHGSKGSYRTVMKGLVDGYRQRWGNDFAVYYVQVAGGDRFEGVFDWEPMSSRYGYAPNREEQRLALGLMGAYANVGMTTAFDYGSPYWSVNGNTLNEGATDGNIHPSAKKPIGERLARLALAKTYGCDLQASGPLFASATAAGGGKVEVAFAAGTTGAGFATCRHDYDTNEDVYETKDQPIFGFALAGEDGVWRWAGAKPKAGDATKLVVASIEVPKPKYVRYAYVNNPADAANLYCRTADGKFLPAIPFGSQEISGWSAAGAMSGTASAGDCTIAFPLAKYYPAGSSREARPFVWGPNGELLGEGKSYVLSYANNQSAGTATVTVTGRGALSGTKSANFTLTAIEMKSCPATVNLNSIGNWPYDGTPKSPGVEFMLPTEISGKMTNRDFYQQRGRSRIMLLEGRDYTVTSVTAPNANAQTFTFTGINGVSGSVTGNATLKIPMGACRADPIPAQAHTGSAVTPKVTLVDPFGKTLVEGTDYTLGYVNNVNAGDCLSSASSPFVKVTAKSSLYAGDLYLPFEIKSGDGLSYTVTFTSFGRTVKTETVARNAAATAPPVSESGWTFDGWDSDFSRVTANLEVKARWTRALTPASFARKATIRFPGAPSETVADFAALVRLSSATIPGFSSADGSDIRFADAQGRLIPHEIDTWQANGESLVWVRVPTLAGPETSVTVYWGGNGAAHPRAEATDTWRGYAGVWHLNETGTGSSVALGESARALATDGGRTGTACDGVIGGARGNPATTSTFDTSPTFLGRTKAADTPALAGRLGEHFTVSTWVRPNLVSDNLPATLFANSCATELHNNYPDRGFGVKTGGNTNYQQASYDTWEVYFHPKSGVSYLNMGALQKRDVWVKLDLVFDGAELRLYADGRFYRRTKSNGFVFPAFNLSKPFAIGGYATGSRLAFNGVYHGDFDEFRLLGEAASAARLAADYATAHDNASFTAYGAATDAGGGDVPPVVHVHDYDWTTKTPATCQAAEVQTGTCGCGDVQTRTVGAPVDHVYVEGKCKWCGRQESAPVVSGGAWYRLTVDAVRSGNDIQFSEFYLYDAQGNRLNLNLTVASVTDATQLKEGECFQTGMNLWSDGGLGRLFDNSTGTKLGGSVADWSNARVIIRLRDGAAVAAYNFATGGDDATWGKNRQLTAWTLETSADGKAWTEIDKVASFDPPAAGQTKYSAANFTVCGEDPVTPSEPDPLSAAEWTACMQGVDTAEKLAAVKARVAGKKTVKIAFANSATSIPSGGTPHDTFEQNEMYQQAAYFGLNIEIVRIQPVDLANGRTLGVVYQEAVDSADIVCDFSSYWDDEEGKSHDGNARDLAAKVIAENPDKLFILPYGEISPCPPTGTSLQSMALKRDGEGFKNLITTCPLGPKTGGALTYVSRRTEGDTETITFVIPSGWAGSTGDTCRSASMAGVLAAWIWAAHGDSPTAVEIIQLMADARALPEASDVTGFTAEQLETLKANLADYVATDDLGRSKLIYDKPVNMYNLLSLLPEPEEPVTSGGAWYRLTVDAVRSGNELQFSEFYLYDAQKNRLNLNLTVASVTDATQLKEGECFQTGMNLWSDGKLEYLFDDSTGTKLGGSVDDWNNARVIIRLRDGAAVAAYNFATGSDDSGNWGKNRQLTAWTLETSEDGQTWAVIAKVTSFDPPAQNKVPYSQTNFTVGDNPEPPPEEPTEPEGPISFSGIFQDHMVLQRDQPPVVWGKGPTGATVTVAFGGESATSEKIGDDGIWTVVFATSFAANCEGRALTATCSNGETAGISDVVVGDVWIAAGQSNMAMALKGSPYGDTYGCDEALAEMKNYPQVRMRSMDAVKLNQPSAYDVYGGPWKAADSGFSAVAFHFALGCVRANPSVPVGILQAALNAQPLTNWRPGGDAILWNSQLAPIVRFRLRGAIWYQGENEDAHNQGLVYKDFISALVGEWREQFGYADTDFPFYAVSLAGWGDVEGAADDPSGDSHPNHREIREGLMRARRSIVNFDLAQIWDCGRHYDIEDHGACIHPRCKNVVGERLALLARKDVYVEDVVADGPYWTGVERLVGGKIRVTFDMGGSKGLATGHKLAANALFPTNTPNAAVKGFAVAGADKVWHWADATIEPSGDAVTLSSATCPNPIFVRYAFRCNPIDGEANLYNAEMLPVAPFATDYDIYPVPPRPDYDPDAPVETNVVWRTGSNPAAFTPASKNLLKGIANATLTDGLLVDTVAVWSDNAMTWTLSEPADLRELGIYSKWSDAGRDGFGIASVAVRYDGEAAFETLVGSELKFFDLNAKGQYAVLAAKDGGAFARNVAAVKVTFGTCDNKWIGLAEVELVSVGGDEPEPSVHKHVMGAWTTNVVPTCQQPGFETRTCEAEGCSEPPYAETNTLAKVDHVYVNGKCKWCHADEPLTLAWTHFGLAAADFVPMPADENAALGCTATGAGMTDGKLNGKSSYQSNWASGPAPVVTFGEPTDISEIRFYSSWDTGRDGFGIKQVNVRYDGETKFTKVESIPEFPYADENKGNMCAAIRAPDGQTLAKNVIAVQIILGTCDNGWIGIGEIEVRKFSGAAPETSVKVDGVDVPLGELFSPANEHRANSGSTIVFPTEPKVVTDEVTQVVSIECGGGRVEVPAYYDVEVSGRNVALSLNEKARPGISVPKEESAPALVVTDEAFSLSADNIIPGFWYWLEMTPQLTPPAWSPCADSLRQAENAAAVPLSASRAGEAGFYRVRTSDVKPALP